MAGDGLWKRTMLIRIVGVVRKYFCYGCGLWYGDESEPESPSDLCPGCKKARA